MPISPLILFSLFSFTILFFLPFFPFCFLHLLAREKLRGGGGGDDDNVSPNPHGLLSQNESRSIKLGDILIEAAGFLGGWCLAVDRSEKECNVSVHVSRTLIRGLRLCREKKVTA